MQKSKILVIGAGAAGLMAARTLAKAGADVTVLEARSRCGGRIYTVNNELIFKNDELGAEFVHGDLPVTLELLKQGGIPYDAAAAEMWHYSNGKFSKEGEFEGWDQVVSKLEELERDISIQDFLARGFPGDDHAQLRKAVIGFVSGYDTADPERASSFALRDEWQGEDFEAQHRVAGGYGAMIKYLEDECRHAGARIYLNSVAEKITWEAGRVEVVTRSGMVYEAAQLIVALPLGVLQAGQAEEGALTFVPSLTVQKEAVDAMGFGSVIKILLEFDAPFWEDEATANLAGGSMRDVGYILSEEEIPTWWTQAPQRSKVLTGWLGGLPAAEKCNMAPEELLELALRSLSNIFKRSEGQLKYSLVAYHIANWTADPFTRGSYAYDTIGAPQAREILNEPVERTIFFAGEYLYQGPAMGTVEAALASGLEAAKKTGA